MTVKQLVRELRYPPSKHIAHVRIEFADGSIFEVLPDTHFGVRRIPVATVKARPKRQGS